MLTGTNGPFTYAIERSGDVDAGYVFTNTHTPSDSDSQTKNLTVKKVWSDSDNRDGMRPSYVRVVLKATSGGVATTVKTVTLDASNNWHETVKNLPTKWNNKEITYTWEEVVPSGYTSRQAATDDTTTFTNSPARSSSAKVPAHALRIHGASCQKPLFSVATAWVMPQVSHFISVTSSVMKTLSLSMAYTV